MKVLIVDDQGSNLALIRMFVTLVDGCEPLPYGDPEAALAAAAQTDIALAIVDYKMPAMDGLGFIRALRALPGKARTPVILATIVDEHHLIRAVLERGMTELAIKPLDRFDMTRRVRRLLGLVPEEAVLRTA
jgi:putative two-component system response regulator